MRTPLSSLICLLLVVWMLPACSSAPSAAAGDRPADYTFPADDYARVHAAAVESLREAGFEIERNDYRFGVITTKPKEAPTAVEFWVDDPTTPAQHRSDTLNAQQRTVKVRIHKKFVLEEALNSTTSGKDQASRYVLNVEVMIERLQRPARYLTHSATARISRQYAAVPAQLHDRGIDTAYAQPLTRDPQFEARLLQAIERRAAEPDQGPAEQPAG